MDKIRVAILSDSPFLNTGYSTACLNVANKLVDAGMEVFYFANNYIGQELPPGTKLKDGLEMKFRIIGGGRENYFKDLQEYKLKELKIDVYMVMLDTFMVFPWFNQLDLSPAKTIFWYPSDGGAGMPLQCESILNKVDLPICESRFGMEQVHKMYGIMKAKFIPIGVNDKLFHPLSKEEKERARAKWGLNGKFVVGTVARNQGRKMLDRTFKAFALYVKENPNAVLFMHTDPNDNAAVFPMQHLINLYKLNGKVIFSGMNFFNGFSYEQMNEVYNVMDVFLLTTSGEGFGMPIIEAMACKIPVLVTDYTTTRELVLDHNSGYGIDLVGTTFEENPNVHTFEILNGTITGSWAVERGICCLKDAVRKLKKLEDAKLREEMGENGRKAVEKYYSWDVVGKQWVDVISKLGRWY